MALIARESGNGIDFEPLPVGPHEAVCYMVCDLGTQHNEKYNKDRHKVLLGWEIPAERVTLTPKDGPEKEAARVYWQKYTLSLDSRATLRQHLESWRGRSFTSEELDGFDLRNLLGAMATIHILHAKSEDGSKTYANIAAIVPVAKGAAKLTPEHGEIWFSLDETQNVPEGVPEWIANLIRGSLEWCRMEKEGDEYGDGGAPMITPPDPGRDDAGAEFDTGPSEGYEEDDDLPF